MGRARLCILCNGIFLKTEEKSRKNFSKGKRKVLSVSVLNAIRLVDLTITGDGLDWPAGPRTPWPSRQATGSPLVSASACRVAVLGGSPRQITLS